MSLFRQKPNQIHQLLAWCFRRLPLDIVWEVSRALSQRGNSLGARTLFDRKYDQKRSVLKNELGFVRGVQVARISKLGEISIEYTFHTQSVK